MTAEARSSKSNQAAIEVVRLSKRYGNGPLANDNIQLQVASGELFSLLGPNGAGKTTLVRQITGELMPTSGEVRVFGIDVVKQPREARRLLGIVPQEAGLFGHLTVQEHLNYFGRMRGLNSPTLRHRITEVMHELNLDEQRRKPALQLSGGLKHKLLVGIAMLGNPRALILDEPTIGLDPHSRREVWDLIRRYQYQGAAVLLTTHYMEEAEALSERVGIISEGRLFALGTVQELHARISNRFKLTYHLPRPDSYINELFTIYGSTVDELHRLIDELGLEEYDIAKTNLEDIYLELTKHHLTTEIDNDTMAY